MALITAEKLTIGYDREPVASNLDFEVCEGDYLCVIGENGAGKSTLIKTILGLIKPLGGKISFGDGLTKNGIGYLPQQTMVQKDFPASVKEIVLSGLQGRSGTGFFYRKKDREIASWKLEQMGIKDLEDACYRDLSGGQQQRVLLARALCAAEKVLLLDEPVAGLDPIGMSEMYELIRSLNEDGTAIIMISHDISAATDHAGHILHMGRKGFFGTKEEYFSSETGRLFLSKQNAEKHFANALMTADGEVENDG